MQTRSFSIILIAFTAVIVFASCSKKSNTQGRYIPKTASMVLQINGEALTAKLPWEEIKTNELFKEIYADTAVSSYIKSVLDNPEVTGIDIKKDLSFFVQKDTSGSYAAVEGVINDASKFKSFLNNSGDKTAEREKDGIHFLANGKINSSWNKERFVIVIDAPNIPSAGKFPHGYDSASTIPTMYKRDLSATTAKLFSLEEENSLAKNEKFSELVNTKADLHFWFNGESINSSSMTMSPLSMMNLNKLYEGIIVCGTANFENGKIVAEIKSYAGNQMTEIWEKYSGSKVNSDMLKRIPGNDIAALIAMNFKPEGIREFLKLAGMDGFANLGASSFGFDLDDFIKANKGDVILAISDISHDSLRKPDAQLLFSVSIGDKNSFSKLIAAGKKLSVEKMGDSAANKFYSNSNENYFVIGNNKERIDKYIGASNNNNFPFLEKINTSPIGAYINFQYILGAMKTDATKDSLEFAQYNATLKMWDNLISTGGGFKNGAITQHVEINLVDKTMNSLKQLNNYLGVMGTIEKKKKAAGYKWDAAAMKMDSLKLDRQINLPR
ncbi:MAG: DUF4836 family protein [Ferruginibacter sp.]